MFSHRASSALSLGSIARTSSLPLLRCLGKNPRVAEEPAASLGSRRASYLLRDGWSTRLVERNLRLLHTCSRVQGGKNPERGRDEDRTRWAPGVRWLGRSESRAERDHCLFVDASEEVLYVSLPSSSYSSSRHLFPFFSSSAYSSRTFSPQCPSSLFFRPAPRGFRGPSHCPLSDASFSLARCFSTLPSTSGCRIRTRQSRVSLPDESSGPDQHAPSRHPSVPRSSSSSSSAFATLRQIAAVSGKDGRQRKTSGFHYGGRLAGGIASASLLLAVAFRKWAREQEEKRKGMWWLSSSSSSSPSLASSAESSSSSFSSAFGESPAPPHPFIPVNEGGEESTPHQLSSKPASLPSGVPAPDQASQTDAAEGTNTFLSPLGPVDVSSSALHFSSLSPVNQLARSIAVSLASRFEKEKKSKSPGVAQPRGMSEKNDEDRIDAARRQARGRAQEEDDEESKRSDSLQVLREVLYGRPVRLEEVDGVGEGEEGCPVVAHIHDCRVLASKEGRVALEEILKATGTIDLTAIGDGEGLDAEDRKAWELIKGGEDKTVMELWESAAFRKIVEVCLGA